jgi:GNAT superfamily N-acetyltransferase
MPLVLSTIPLRQLFHRKAEMTRLTIDRELGTSGTSTMMYYLTASRGRLKKFANTRAHLLLHGTSIVAWAISSRGRYFDTGGRYCELQIYVQPSYRRRGLAATMVERIIVGDSRMGIKYTATAWDDKSFWFWGTVYNSISKKYGFTFRVVDGRADRVTSRRLVRRSP